MATRWTVRRTAARRAVVAAVSALVAVTAFVLAGVVGYADLAGTQGVRDYFSSAGNEGAALQVQTRQSGDAERQRQAADELFDELYQGLNLDVHRSVVLRPQPVEDTKQTLLVAAYDGFAEHARLVSGDWHDGVALSRAAARRLGLEVGDTIEVGGTSYDVGAVWQPLRESDPFFTADAEAGDDPAALAANRAALGILVVPDLSDRGEAALARWTIVPDAERVEPREMTAMARAVDATPDAFDDAGGVTVRGSTAAGDLSTTLRTVSQSLEAALAVSPVPSLLIAAISLLMVVQLSRLLTLERRSETALVRSRGASAAQLTRISAVEGAAVAVPSAAGGTLLAEVLLRLNSGAVPWLGWLLALLTALVAVAVLVVPAALQARQTADRQQIDDSGRARVLAAGGVVVLLVGAALLSTWRFRRAGSAAVVDVEGNQSIDPVAVLAPALSLIAAALLAGLLFGVLAGAVERVTARGRGLHAVLAARQVARRSVVFGVAVLMVAIAVGGATLAATYARTQTEAQRGVDAMRNGAILRADVPLVDPLVAGVFTDPVKAVAELPSVRTALPAQQLDVEVGTVDASLTGIAADRLSDVVPEAIRAATDPLAALHGEAQGWPLPAGTTALTLRVSAAAAWQVPGGFEFDDEGEVVPTPGGLGPRGETTTIDVSVWVQSPDGAVVPVWGGGVTVPVARQGTGTPRPAEVTAQLDGLPDGSRVVAVDVTSGLAGQARLISMNVLGATATTPAGPQRIETGDQAWAVQPAAGDFEAPVDGVGLAGSVGPGQMLHVRVGPSAGDEPTLPVVVDRRLARELQVGPGDTVTVTVEGSRDFQALVRSVRPKLPGATGVPRIYADLEGLSLALLRTSTSVPSTNQLWIAPADGQAAAAAVPPLLPPTSTVVLADNRSATALLAPAARTLWFGAAGALLLAAIGVGSVVATLAQAREGELVVLRSVGLSALQQGRARRRELLWVLVTGWLLGIAVGVVAVFATVPGLAGSALVDSSGDVVTLRLDATTWALLVGAHVLAVLLLVAAHATVLRRQVLAAIPSGARA